MVQRVTLTDTKSEPRDAAAAAAAEQGNE